MTAETGVTQNPAPGRLELVVSTWHVSLLLGGQPYGLPADLLSTHSALLYVVDKIVCDGVAFRGEEASRDTWISATVFGWLKDAGLVREVNLHGSKYLPSRFWDDLTRSPVGVSATNRADELGERIASGDRDAMRHIDSSLVDLNRAIFLGLETPPNWLPYYQTAGPLGASPVRAPVIPRLPGVLTTGAQWHGLRLARLINLIAGYLPDPELLPPLTTPFAKGALTTNMEAEKRYLYPLIYGQGDHANYRDIRLSKPFTARDAHIDSKERLARARRNFDRLIEIRAQTTDLRWSLQDVVLKVVDGGMPAQDAYLAIEAQVDSLRHYIQQDPFSYTKVGARILSAGLVDWFLSARLGLPKLGPVGPAMAFEVGLETLNQNYLRGYWMNRRTAKGRRIYPLGSFSTALKNHLGTGLGE